MQEFTMHDEAVRGTQEPEPSAQSPHVAVPFMGGRAVFRVGFDPETGRILSSVRTDVPILLGGCRYDLLLDLAGSRGSSPFPFGPEILVDEESIVLSPASGGDILGLSGLPDGTPQALSSALRRTVATRQVDMHASGSAGLSELLGEAFAVRVAALEALDHVSEDDAASFLSFVRIVENRILVPAMGLPSAHGWMLVDRPSGVVFRFPHVDPATALQETFFATFDELHACLTDGLVDPGDETVAAVLSIGHPIPVVVKDADEVETPHVEPDGVVEWTAVDFERQDEDDMPRMLAAANDDGPRDAR